MHYPCLFWECLILAVNQSFLGTSMVLPGIQSFVVLQECAMHYYYRRKYLRLAAESDRSQLTESVEEEYPAVENDSEASNGVPEIAT